jgi:cytosine/adenosine deaminase-related metal-dependent hydrolase
VFPPFSIRQIAYIFKMIRTVHTAKYVLTEAGMLLRNAAVHVSDPGRISRIEPWQHRAPGPGFRVIDWDSAIIMPGLVNAHSHLEEICPAGLRGMDGSWSDWLAALAAEGSRPAPETCQAAAARGARASLAAGTTLIGAIASCSLSCETLREEWLRKVVFKEITAFPPDQAGEVIQEFPAQPAPVEPDERLTPGLSVRAPYSVSPELFRTIAELGQRRRERLAIHLAETKQELELLQGRQGEFKDFLTAHGLMPEGWRPPETAPVSFLDGLGVFDQPAVLVHCNYLDQESMARILSRNCSVVYCPRSHAFFGHERHPVRELLNMGVNVAIGTDLSSGTESLSLLDEMRFLFRERKDLRCDEIIRMATLNGAVALDFGGVLGRLRRGYWADMTVLELPETMGERNVEAQILEGAGACLATIVQGKIVWTKAPGGRTMEDGAGEGGHSMLLPRKHD